MQFKASQMSRMDTVVDFLLRSTCVYSKSPEWNLTVQMQQMMIQVKGSLLCLMLPPVMTSLGFCKTLNFVRERRSELQQSPEEFLWDFYCHSSVKIPAKNIFRPLESHINQYDRYAWKNVCFPMSIFGPCFPIRTILGRINLLRK